MRTDERDHGMTLTELLITVSILGVVAIALSGAVVAFLKHQDNASDRIDRSRGLQQLVNYLPADVASSQRIETSGPWTNPCLGIGTPILNLLWGESFPGADAVAVTVTYIRSSDNSELIRRQCGTEGTSTQTMARNLTDAHAELGSIVAGQVDMVLNFDDGERTLTASSRNR